LPLFYRCCCRVENIHFHGHKFAVMAMKFPTYDSVTGHWTIANDDISCGSSELCWKPTWNPGHTPSFQTVTQPPVKDTLVIPTRGYVVLRFRSTNPGPFMLHCHLDSHVMEGMAMIVDIAPHKWPPLPRGFPTFCDPDAK
jgi:FtsP/CotA-like multicopper oxidase with cupredoxin domain